MVRNETSSLGLTPSTDVLVVSDHGFTTNVSGVDVAGALIDAGLKASVDSRDVVLASSGQAVALHVEGHDRERIARIARLVHSREWGGVVFTSVASMGRSWSGGALRSGSSGGSMRWIIHCLPRVRKST